MNQAIKLVALDQDNNAVMRFKSLADASAWADKPADDIITAYELAERLYGYKYILDSGDYPMTPTYGEDSLAERSKQAMHAIQLITNLDQDGCAFDILTSSMLTAEEIFEKYLKTLKVIDVYEGLRELVQQKHKIMDEEDARKKKIDRLIIEQPEFDDEGVKCVYVLTENARSVLEQFMKEDEIKGVVPEHDWEEGFLCTHEDIRYFCVNTLREEYSFEEWREGRDASNNPK